MDQRAQGFERETSRERDSGNKKLQEVLYSCIIKERKGR